MVSPKKAEENYCVKIFFCVVIKGLKNVNIL